MPVNEVSQRRLSQLAEFYGSIFLIVLGAIVTVVVAWFFEGLGFWSIFGLIILFAGISNIIYGLFSEKLPKPNSTLRAGLLVLFIGLACLISFLPHVLLGTFQIMTFIVVVIGVIITSSGLYQGMKK